MKPISKTVVLAAVLAASLTFEPVMAQVAPVPFFAGGMGSLLKQRKRVAIPAYHVTYITAVQGTAVAGINARSRLAVNLVGLDEATMRKLADEAHADLKAQFAAAGIAVVADEEAQTIVAEVPKLPGNRADKTIGATITIGKGMARGFTAVGASKAPALTPFQTVDAGPMAMAGQIGAIMKMSAKSQPLDAIIMVPALTINFASLSMGTGSGTNFLGGTTRGANVSGGLGASIDAVNSRVSLVSANDRGAGTPGGFSLTKDIPIPGAFAAIQTGEGNVRAMATGSSRGDVAQVDIPAYENVVRTTYKAYNAGIVQAVVKGKG